MSKQQVFIDLDILKWLQSLGVVGHQQQQMKGTGKLGLDQATSLQFMNGFKFGELIQKVMQDRQRQGENIPMVPSVDSLKDASTPGVRLFNWNLVSDTLHKIGFPFDKDIKAMIMQGDCEMVNEVLRDLMDNENSRQERASRASSRSGVSKKKVDESLEMRRHPKPPIQAMQILSTLGSGLHLGDDDTVNIGEIETTKPLNETISILEFFLIGLSRNLSLRPKQVIRVYIQYGKAAALLSNGNKYLAHVMVKGVKDEFVPIINWLSEIYANLGRVYQFMTSNDMNVGIFLTTIKPGLLSKHMDVSLWTLRVYSKVLFELANLELHPQAYQWFTRELGGLSACFLCLKRHPYLVQQVCDVLVQACRFNTNDFFSVQFRKLLDQGRDYLEMINTLIEPLTQTKSIKEDLLNTGLVKFWSDLALKQADAQSPESKATAITYLTHNWLLYPIQFEEEQNLTNQYLFIAKRATRERSTSLRYVSLHCMFRLLEQFANERNPFAAVLYKKLTFSLIENFDDLETRDYMEANFMNLFTKFSTVPIDILLEPLIKQCHVSETKTMINLCDMNLLHKCCSHPKMTLRLSLSLLDLMSKIYLNDPIMSQLSFQQIQVLLTRYIENEPVQEYSFKLAKVALSNYMVSVSSKVVNPKISNPAFAMNNEIGIMNAQKRSQIIQLLKYVINLNQLDLNGQLKSLIVHHYLEIMETLKREDKGLLTLLFLFGNPDDVIEEAQEQWQQEKILKQIQYNIFNRDQQVEDEGYNEFSEMVQESVLQRSDEVVEENEDDDEEGRALQFLISNGVGVKQKVKDRESSMPRKSTKVDPKVLDSLASIRLKKEEQEINKQQVLQEKLKRQLQMKKQAQSDIAKRNAYLYCCEILNEIITDSMGVDEVTVPVPVVVKKKLDRDRSVKRNDEDVKKKRDPSQKRVGQIVNKALEDKQRQLDEQEILKVGQDMKFRKHQERVKEQFQRMKVEKEKEDFTKKDEERSQEIQKADKEKSLLEYKKKSAVDNKQKLQEYKGKLDEEKRKQDSVEIEETKVKVELKRKEQEQMKRKHQQEVQKMIEEKKKGFKEKGDKEKKKEKKQQDELQEWKDSVQGMLKEEQVDRQHEKESLKKIQQMMLDPSFQEVFKKHERSLQTVYTAYQEYSDWRIDNAEAEKDLLPFKGFTNFASQFNIYPIIITPEQSHLVFNSIAREREKQFLQDNKTAPNGMGFHEFEQALLRITIKGQKAFDLISDQFNLDMRTGDMIKMVKESKSDKEESKQKEKKIKFEEDLYSQVDFTTPKTLEGLMIYLDMPHEKPELLTKLRALKLEYQKVVAPRDKKKIYEQKVGEDKKRMVSANRKVINAPKKVKQDDRKQENDDRREKSQENDDNRDKSQENRQLTEVDPADLNDKGVVNVVGPGGEKENWQVE